GVALLVAVGRGPMRHGLAGIAWLAGHTRPGRFARAGVVRPFDTALRPLDLSMERLGVLTPRDFTQPELASFDACVQCGRCEEVCPAFAAGQRLNPKALIQGLSGAMREQPAPYCGSPSPHAPVMPGKGGMETEIIGGMLAPDTLWACTTCRACVEECPMLIEHVDAVIALRRGQTLMKGAVPAGAGPVLRASRERAEPGGRALEARTDAIAALDVPVLAAGEATDILLWLGEGAYDLRYGRSLRALVTLMRKAGVRFATLGADEVDCGDAARRLGDEATFQALAREAIGVLGTRTFRTIVTADPHAYHVLKNEYPALGGTWSVEHHTTFLDALVQGGQLTLAQRDGPAVAYHDPCYLGRYNGVIDAPRRLLDAACRTRVEVERHGLRSMCCGGGGGGPASDVDAVTRIPDLRMEQFRHGGAGIVAVACPGCTAMLEGVTGMRPDVKDVAELVLESLVP
ncbi:(Fe-S)-binding protein, partial [Ameyamaea chiangmaiensis]